MEGLIEQHVLNLDWDLLGIEQNRSNLRGLEIPHTNFGPLLVCPTLLSNKDRVLLSARKDHNLIKASTHLVGAGTKVADWLHRQSRVPCVRRDQLDLFKSKSLEVCPVLGNVQDHAQLGQSTATQKEGNISLNDGNQELDAEPPQLKGHQDTVPRLEDL